MTAVPGRAAAATAQAVTTLVSDEFGALVVGRRVQQCLDLGLIDEIRIAGGQAMSGPFNQDTSGAKKAAERGPVYITDRGRPAHVLLTY
jgi:hypothetical protein